MRVLPMILLLGALCTASAQSDSTPSAPSLFESQVPQITVNVKKHPMGADMVEVTATAAGYPTDLMRSQIKALGDALKSEPRGVQIGSLASDPGNPSMQFVNATFAIDGLIDRRLGSFRLNPIAKAFAGAPKPWTVTSIALQFEGEAPTDNMIRSWRGKSVLLQGRATGQQDANLKGVEYRIQLLSQDPTKFDIPEPGDKPVQPAPKAPKPAGIDWTSVVVLLVGAASVGALVYSLLLRGRPKARFKA